MGREADACLAFAGELGIERAVRGIALGVGVSTGSSQLALVHDEIFGADQFAREIGFQDLARASGVRSESVV